MTTTRLLGVLLIAVVATGCAGTRTFYDIARAGDTVAVPVGWKHHFTPDDLVVTLTPQGSSPLIYTANDPVGPGDPTIRAVTNFYIDPLASIVVSRETDQDLTPFARTYAHTTHTLFTGDDKDWWQTVVFLDLPTTLPDLSPLPVGPMTVQLDNSHAESVSMTLDIVPGTGSSHGFEAEILGPMTPPQLAALRRVDHYTVNFTGATVPHAIQIDLAHSADVDSGGSGRAYVVNPIGYIKNISWTDDGLNTRVILLPTREAEIETMTDFKFYVAGGVENLIVVDVQAFDINGDIVPGVAASVTP